MLFNTDFDLTYFCSRSCPFRVLLHTPALRPFERFTLCRYFVCPLLSLFFWVRNSPHKFRWCFVVFVRTSSLSLSAPKTFYETTKKKRRKLRRRRLCALARASDRDKKSATTPKTLLLCRTLELCVLVIIIIIENQQKFINTSWLTSQS